MFSVTGDEVILGREEGIDVSIRDPEVSRRHSRIMWQSGGYYVEDLNSTNGTFLNGALVTSPQPLRSGDTIGVGQTVLVFQAETVAVPEQHTARAPYPAAQPPPMPAPQERRTNRCLIVGCGCLVLLLVSVVILLGVMYLVFPQELEDFINNILNLVGLQVDMAMLSASYLFV